MRVLAVTSWGGACGIANYAQMLIEAVGQADPSIIFEPSPSSLDPTQVHIPRSFKPLDLIWLNYHRGLHSRWTPEQVQKQGRDHGIPVVITMHDTYGERPPDPLAQSLHDLADAFVVHEPCEGLERQILIRQGVPAEAVPEIYDHSLPPSSWGRRPVLGTCGFNFPWKNFDRLAEVTAEAGWAYVVVSNNLTNADTERWLASNRHTLVVSGFLPTPQIVSYLAGCDATCFAYECANSGTSGAIRLGIAARKPVLAFNACRQFRDLVGDDSAAIRWCGMDGSAWDELRLWLISDLPIQRCDPGIVYLAHRDSWVNHGHRYAEVFRSCLTSH